MPTKKTTTAKVAVLLCGAALAAPGAAMADTDCSVRESSRDDPSWTCRKASEWAGGCVPSSAFQTWGCLELDTDAQFCSGSSPYNVSVYLTTDGVSLDCQGQTIDHAYQDGDSKRPGIRTPYSYSVDGIEISDCNIQNTGRYGVDLKRFFRGAELDGPMAGHQDIHLQNVSILNTAQIGVYVGQNSRGMKLSDVTIDGAYGGIYLEAGSEGTRIERATIVNSTDREAVSVDSSAHNVILDSFFAGNPDGINLYKNCGETSGQICPITRTTGANHNLIRGCTFVEDQVNVAWRMFDWYGAGFCENIDVLGYWYDESKHNVFDANIFDGEGLDVDDGPIVVHKNEFSHAAMLEIGISTPIFWPGHDVHVVATVASNTFGNAAGIDLEGNYSVTRFENRNFAGTCEPDNPCTFGDTTLWGEQVVSMGAWAVVL